MRRKRLADAARWPTAVAHQAQRADHVAHLMMQEAARLCGDGDHVAVACDIQPVQCAQGRVGLAGGGAERGEIVPPDQRLRRRCIAAASSGAGMCQTRPSSSAGRARRLRMR